MTDATLTTRETRLIAFPHAGGTASCYQRIARALPKHIRLISYEPPGHGARLREPLRRTMASLVDDAFEWIQKACEPPYALYGHSLGAWLARDVLRRIHAISATTPRALFVSGARAPTERDTTVALHELPPHAFRAQLSSWGGTPPAVLADPELMALFEPILRADLEVLASCSHERLEPLDVPIHVALGDQDQITPEQADAWRHETTLPITLTNFDGGHFFIREHAAGLASLIEGSLGELPWEKA